MGHGGRYRDRVHPCSRSGPRSPFDPRDATLLLFALMLFPFFLLFALPAIVLAAKDNARQQLVKLAAENNGVVKLDTKTFDLITTSQRDWSASILFTALDKRRKCAPCR